MAGSTSRQPEKTANIWRRYHWFPLQMTFEKQAQKFHTDDASLPRSGWCFWLVVRVVNLIQPMRGTTQIWLVTCHQYGISVLISQTSFGGETSGGVTKCHFTGKPVVSSWNVGCFLRLMSRQRARMNRTMYSDLLMGLSWKKVKTVVLKFVKVWATSKLIINDLLESASNPHKW